MEVEIQGIVCTYRDLRQSTVDEDGVLTEGEEILYANLPQEEQYFRRIEHPFTDEDELVEIASVPYDERIGKYNKIQAAWVEREERRMTYGNGVYAMIDGVITYMPASYWGYINHWTLETGEQPEYREADRVFFLFFEYICFETDILAITRGKSRRIGATSIGFYLMWWICGRLEEKRGGSISFNDDAAGRNFNTMFMRGFKGMLPCFVRDFDSAAEKFVRFVKPVEKAKRGVIRKREGLNSYCDYLSNSLNAYDSQRVSLLLADETGKYEKMDINTYWSKVSPTLKMGRRKVGFAYMPTTVNPKNKGGENYKKFWDESNQNAINENTGKPYGLGTRHRVVRYFVPATEGYAGCIDKFGRSVIEDPAEPVIGNDGQLITEGALSVITKERLLKEGEQRMEHQRDFPLDEYDMFAFETGNCEFNSEMLKAYIRELDENPVFLRKIRITDTKKYHEPQFLGQKRRLERIMSYMDDENNGWLLLEKPEKENDFTHFNGIYSVNAGHKYIIGADTKRIWSSTEGSFATICVFKTSCVINGIETGNYPVAFFIGKPKLPSFFYEEIIKACLWYGGKANIERSAGDHFNEYFYKQGMEDLLLWTPARNPVKPQKVLVGTESASPFELAAQLECAKLYLDGNNPMEYNGNIPRVKFRHLLQEALEYNHSERTPYDSMIALMMCLLVALKAPLIKRHEHKPKSLLPKFEVNKFDGYYNSGQKSLAV